MTVLCDDLSGREGTSRSRESDQSPSARLRGAWSDPITVRSEYAGPGPGPYRVWPGSSHDHRMYHGKVMNSHGS
eukprot:762520-Hanusia_phi.AAC.1